ncbi:amidase [Pseudolabrys taiwanensis]|uniref:Indoleacetamide hydrolase n=1 Tax=Pseudolabrys taiwanensis TaxID=331696 RepID=A0A345ZUS7_9HYPH|nr:amidase [Pseudolabrys taiwanensis]AXK80674.1 amidase [Pseudolabrys taiwanensis]
MDDGLWRWSAVDLADAIAARRVSSREATESALARLAAVNPRINAVVDVLAEEALAAAAAADAALARGESGGPLHGVPVTVKINVDYAGRPTTTGVVAFKDDIAAADSPPIASLRAAGAVIIGRTNVPAFCARFFTDNDLHGRTLNPWDAGRTPGGSSGGAAAAVATGIGAIAHGTDRAGSIRYPAYACGVVGLRPSFGRVAAYSANPSVEATLASQLMSVQGPLARSVGDVALGLRGMMRGDARDPWWMPAPMLDETERPLRVAVFEGTAGAAVDPAVAAAVRRAAGWLAEAGCEVAPATPPAVAELADMFFSMVKTEEGEGTSRAIERLGDDALRRARAGTMARATKYTLEAYVDALGRRTAILRQWQAFLEQHDALLLPVSYRAPLPIDEDQKGDDAVARMIDAHEPMLAVSMLGLPSLAMPTGIDGTVPTGVQIVSGRFKEALCLRIGAMIEAACPPATPIDPAGPL